MTLDKLHIGQGGTIAAVGGEGALRRRFLDMGLTPVSYTHLDVYKRQQEYFILATDVYNTFSFVSFKKRFLLPSAIRNPGPAQPPAV